LTEWWEILPLLPRYPITVWLVRQKGSWLLIDTGLPTMAQQLRDALRTVVPASEKLSAILGKADDWWLTIRYIILVPVVVYASRTDC
jgi:glyoxylase-like metal-dependent hydrolase (beta-lactamase superfamily II)